jgi:hypothetical protein
MSPEIQQFLNANASAVFGLLGALGGGILSFVASLLLKRREFSLQLRSKIIDKQIAAHESILKLAQDMRVMGSVGTRDIDGEISRGPCILLSKNAFEEWFTRFTEQQLAGSTWLTTRTKREVAFVQDYLVTLHMCLVEVPSEKYFDLAQLIRQDFIDLSSSLEKAAFSFFESGIHRGKLDSLSARHKYKRPITERRLTNTALIQNIAAFKSAYRGYQNDD